MLWSSSKTSDIIGALAAVDARARHDRLVQCALESTSESAAIPGDAELPCGDWTDQALVGGVVAHRENACAELFRRHGASVSATVRMVLGDSPTCDDIVADVFIEFWFAPMSFNPDRGPLLNYLRMRARNRSIDALRSETSRRRREEEDLHASRDPLATVDSELLASEAAAALRQAVSQLPKAEREAIQLAFFHGMSYRAVAAHLDISEGTIKSRIRNGLRHLRHGSELRSSLDISHPPAPPPDPESLLTTDIALRRI